MDDDRETDPRRRPGAADRGGRLHLRPHPAGPGARARLQGAGRQPRRTGAGHGAQVQAGRHHARYRLPDTTGWTVLDRLKHDPDMRHIPVHVFPIDENRRRGLALGAASHSARKPRARRSSAKRSLRIQHSLDRRMREAAGGGEATKRNARRLLQLIGNGDVHTTALGSAQEALAACRRPGFRLRRARSRPARHARRPELIGELQSAVGERDLPVIVYRAARRRRTRSIALQRAAREHRYCGAPIPRSACWTRRRCFLHRVEAEPAGVQAAHAGACPPDRSRRWPAARC